MGKGAVDEGYPPRLGAIGYSMCPGGVARHQRRLVEEADVILLVGNRTNQNGTVSWRLLPRSARFIHLDIDGAEIGRNYEALRLLGDAKLTLAALTIALQARDSTKRRAARPAVEDRKSTRLNSSHSQISYAVFCLKKKKSQHMPCERAPPSRLRGQRPRPRRALTSA